MIITYYKRYQIGTIILFFHVSYHNSYFQKRVQMLERLLWIIADESYYDDDTTKAYLPSKAWFLTNKYFSTSSIEFLKKILILKKGNIAPSLSFLLKDVWSIEGSFKEKDKRTKFKEHSS